MCNLYSLTKGQAAIRDWFRAPHDRTGNLPLFPAIFPDQLAPIIRVGTDGERELVMARWGMPGPPQFSMRDLIAARTAVMTATAAIDADTRPMARASAARRRLMTIPGVGQLTALAFVAAIDDPFAHSPIPKHRRLSGLFP
jgi:transposase